MGFSLGKSSIKELAGVHPDLVRVVERAIQITTQDFGVHDGVRTVKEQTALVKAGASKTMKSKHLLQDDGYGHAVDLVPFINGKLRWEWPAIYPIAEAVRTASIEVGVSLVWGAVWDRELDTLSETALGLSADVNAYQVRHPGKDFLDGPHYQLA
ncbi:M15 family metallopeptidase [Methylobrevis albus]|uniref:M15 family metallopeptidase n=1 Tax=Methylobrevis albus TaxID=2793297 RepID=A0A931MX72_9HYPH|nr:M15 family metallopeptidase [Methylobrevis albus]MBH0238568.1 M15 family metallopeptidase [Methylobrevis albus]